MAQEEGIPRRFSARRKQEGVLRLLRGEELDALSRELGVTAAMLSDWWEIFLTGGKAALKSRPEDDHEAELRRLQAKVGEITMESELLLERARAAERFIRTLKEQVLWVRTFDTVEELRLALRASRSSTTAAGLSDATSIAHRRRCGQSFRHGRPPRD